MGKVLYTTKKNYLYLLPKHFRKDLRNWRLCENLLLLLNSDYSGFHNLEIKLFIPYIKKFIYKQISMILFQN